MEASVWQTGFPVTSAQWGDAWKATQADRALPPDAARWNERAKTFGNSDSPNNYTQRFLELAGVLPGETVFDMGCGVGNLALPFAASGHRVLAADFSEVMLERLHERARAAGIAVGEGPASAAAAAVAASEGAPAGGTGDAFATTTAPTLQTMQLSWEENWEARGITPESFDVCVASRSIATADLRDSILRLSAAARRRACITMAAGTSPQVDDDMLAEIGLATTPPFDYVYALAILVAEGFRPELTYIETDRWRAFDTPQDAREKFMSMAHFAIKKTATPLEVAEIESRVDSWLVENLTQTGEGTFTMKRPHKVSWAFISWNKR